MSLGNTRDGKSNPYASDTMADVYGMRLVTFTDAGILQRMRGGGKPWYLGVGEAKCVKVTSPLKARGHTQGSSTT